MSDLQTFFMLINMLGAILFAWILVAADEFSTRLVTFIGMAVFAANMIVFIQGV